MTAGAGEKVADEADKATPFDKLALNFDRREFSPALCFPPPLAELPFDCNCLDSSFALLGALRDLEL